ncbi:MAG: chloramphenicol acetyltransferase [Pseudomonadota bacterium]
MAKLTEDEPVVHEECSVTETQFGRFVELGHGTRIAYSRLGDYSYTDRYADIANADIGKFANIASFVRIGATDHPMSKASLHHFLYRSSDYWDDAEHDAEWFALRRSRITRIGHDTWIGHAAQVKPDVIIGHGAVIASGAVVTKNVADYSIVAGVPARPVRDRFPEEIKCALINLAWWDWDHARLREALQDFRDLSAEAFIKKHA